MKKNLINIIIIFVLILIIYFIYKYFNKRDNFEPDNRINHDLINDYNPKNKVCIVEIKYNDDGSDKFKYTFTKKEDYDYRNFINTPLKRIFVEGINNWNNNNCSEENNILGGCRNDVHECSNFMTKDECEDYKMEWYENNPCTNNFNPDVKEFKWEIYNLDDYKKTLGEDNKEKDTELNVNNYNPFLIDKDVYLLTNFDDLPKNDNVDLTGYDISSYSEELSEDETSVNFDPDYKTNDSLDPNYFSRKLF